MNVYNKLVDRSRDNVERRRITHSNSLGSTLITIQLFLAGLLDIRPFVFELCAHVFLSPAQLGGIHSDEKTFDTALLRMLHNTLGDLAVSIDV